MRRAIFLAAAIGASALLLPTSIAAQDQAAVQPCAIDYLTSPEMLALIQADNSPFAFEGFEAFCQRLAQEGAGLQFDHHAGISTDRSYGWVSVGLIDLASGIPSVLRATTITVSDSVESQEQQGALLESLATVVANVAADPEPFLTSMRAKVAETRQRLAPQ